MGELQQSEPPHTPLVLDDEVQIGTFVCKALTSFAWRQSILRIRWSSCWK